MDIAICDDDVQQLEEIRQLLMKCHNIGFIETFSNIESFMKSITDGVNYDMVFMDIVWRKSKNGIDYANWLYRISPRTKIVFVTGYSQQYIEAVFMKDTNITGYLEKPVKLESLKCILEKGNRDISNYKTEAIAIKQKGKLISLPYKEICYLESIKHNVIFHMINEDISVYDSLKNIMDILPSNFFQCHKSFVVNFDHVKMIKEKEAVLECCGIERNVVISRQKKKSMENAFFNYLWEDAR
ncbi:MAG: LytR/AlgR family response regulator transcription factor [Lachnospira sp.]